MKTLDVIEKLEKELPELNWTSNDRWFNCNFACTGIYIDKNDSTLDMSIQVKKRIAKLLFKNKLISNQESFKKDILKITNEKYYEDDIIYLDSLDETSFDLIIKGLKLWKEFIDNLRKSDNPKDQLIIIHPDWDIEGFKKDFKIIVENHSDSGWPEGLGIMSTGEWDFGSSRLCDELNENSGDCFSIWVDEEDMLEDDCSETYEELKKQYPEVINIPESRIYCTDFD